MPQKSLSVGILPAEKPYLVVQSPNEQLNYFSFSPFHTQTTGPIIEAAS